MSIIQFKEANCKNCYKCIRNCEVKAINFKNEQAEIIEKDCILCGHCFLACPQNAKYIDSDLALVKQMIAKGEKVYVSLAPSYVSMFGGVSVGKMSAALKKLGFLHVEETAIGAAQVSAQYAKMINEHKMANIITTACPTSVLLVEKYYPELIPYLAPAVSPMVAHARMMREVYGPRIKVVFIGPCISKKYEAADTLEGNSGVNAVLMFEELQHWLAEERIDVSEMEEDGREMKGIINRLYPVPGGILRTLVPKQVEKNYKHIAIDGIDRCMEALESLRSEKLTGYFIEMNACPGACLAGPSVKSAQISFLKAKDMALKNAKTRAKNAEAPISEDVETDFSKVFLDRSDPRPMPSEREIIHAMHKMGKTSPDKELNCGSCGYPTCRDKAIAVCQGKADPRMCLPHMREKAESISNVVIENTPNGIILVDDRFSIIEYNPAAAEIFGLNDKDYVGRLITDVFECDQLFQVQRTGREVMNDVQYYPELDLALEQSILYIAENNTYLLLLRNVSDEVQQQKKLGEMRSETVEVAQKVIDKQMRVAQEIASLLGETTAETKLALTKLKKSILADAAGEEKK